MIGIRTSMGFKWYKSNREPSEHEVWQESGEQNNAGKEVVEPWTSKRIKNA